MKKLQRGLFPGSQANSAHAFKPRTSIQKKITVFLDEALGDGWELLERRSKVVFPSPLGLEVTAATVNHFN